MSLQLMGTKFHLTSAPSLPPARHKPCEPSTRIKGTRKLSRPNSPQHRHRQIPLTPAGPHIPAQFLDVLPSLRPRELRTGCKKPWKMALQSSLCCYTRRWDKFRRSSSPCIKGGNRGKLLPAKTRESKEPADT